MTIRGARWFVACAALVLAGLAPGVRAEDDAEARRIDWDVYQRDVKSIERAVVHLAAEARSRGASEVLVALDQITFHPPPGHNEWTEAHDYAGDLAAWLAAIESWAKRGPTIHVVGTLGPAPLRVGPPGWQDAVTKALDYDWYEDSSFRGFEPAVRWIHRWTPRAQGMVVLIASEFGPERWADHGRLGVLQGDESWREHLRDPGDYWDEEAVGNALERVGAALLVVAPEVLFGDELPLPALPAAPWASRPRRPPVVRLDLPEAADSTKPRTPAPEKPEAQRPSKAALRRQLDTLLTPWFPDPAHRERIIDRILAEVPKPAPAGESAMPPAPPPPPADGETPPPGGRGPAPPTSGGAPTPPPAPKELILYGRRFRSDTALWFPHYGGTVLLNDHTPSAFGYWPYARSAARTGGRYLGYPFPPAEWLDACPRDAHQLKRLAPELMGRSRILKARANDPALQALSRAEDLVLRGTPWSDRWGTQVARGWDAFETVRPLDLTRGFRPRRKPFDTHQSGTHGEFERRGKRLAELVLEYDAALDILDRALKRVADGKDTKSHPRSVADLRLARFWFSMSAFHLDALGIYMREIERFVPKDFDLKHARLIVTYLPAIRMSDCLDAYDDRVLTPEAEAAHPRVVHRAWRRLGTLVWPDRHVVPGQQGNLLNIPEDDPNYRAKRSLSSVLLHLDRRLMPRALEMIEAGREVMRHHARTPWGWTTYYSEAHTFVYLPVNEAVWAAPRSGTEDEDEPGPVTPSPVPRGGSSPGGPTTPR